jgi:hypothetical protein
MLENFVNSDYDFRMLPTQPAEDLTERHVDKSMLDNSFNDSSNGITNRIEILIQTQNFRQLSIKLNQDSIYTQETGNEIGCRIDNGY